MTRLLAVDPGVTSGWSIWLYDDLTPLRHVAHGMIGGGARGFARAWEEGGFERAGVLDVVVSESFVQDGRTARPNLEPLRIEGVLAALWRGPLYLQRNTYKRHTPDDLLKQIGCYWPGPGHDRDSARHAIAHMLATVKHRPTEEWLHPRGVAA